MLMCHARVLEFAQIHCKTLEVYTRNIHRSIYEAIVNKCRDIDLSEIKKLYRLELIY